MDKKILQLKTNFYERDMEYIKPIEKQMCTTSVNIPFLYREAMKEKGVTPKALFMWAVEQLVQGKVDYSKVTRQSI